MKKYKEIQKILKENNLSAQGNRDELLERLKENKIDIEEIKEEDDKKDEADEIKKLPEDSEDSEDSEEKASTKVEYEKASILVNGREVRVFTLNIHGENFIDIAKKYIDSRNAKNGKEGKKREEIVEIKLS